MKVTYNQIKPLIADATLVDDKMICKFRDRKTGQVILSSADFRCESMATNKFNDSGMLKTFVRFLTSKTNPTKASEQEAILRAFEKIGNHFEAKDGMIQLKAEYFVKDVWNKSSVLS